MQDPSQFVNSVNSGGSGLDMGQAMSQLQQMLGYGSNGAGGYGMPAMNTPGMGPTPQGQGGTPTNGQNFISLGAWNNPQNPYLNAGRGPGTAQQISGNGQVYDWNAPPPGAMEYMRNTPGFDWSAQSLQNVGNMFGQPSQLGGGQAMQGWGSQQGAMIPPDMMSMFGGAQQGGQQGGGMQDLLSMLLGGSNQGIFQTAPNRAMSSIPGTYTLPGAQGIQGGGMQANPFQGDVSGRSGIGRLEDLAGADAVPNFLRMLSGGQAIGNPSNMNDTLMQLGQFNGTPSPQSLNNLNPSENQFLQGFMESILGIPWADITSAAYQPFQGLNTARKPRRNYGTS